MRAALEVVGAVVNERAARNLFVDRRMDGSRKGEYISFFRGVLFAINVGVIR